MFVFFASIIKSQSNVENIYAPSAGYYSGGFLNLADDGLDAEVFLNLQNKLGLYNNMWAGQIDYYSNTDIVSNVSFGLNRPFSKTISYDGIKFNSLEKALITVFVKRSIVITLKSL